MQNRFSFNNWDQVELFHEYLDEMVDKFLQQNTTYEIIPLSSLMNKNMQNTLGYLKTTLPLQVTARVISATCNASGKTCSDYLVQADPELDPKEAQTTCEPYDFTNPM